MAVYIVNKNGKIEPLRITSFVLLDECPGVIYYGERGHSLVGGGVKGLVVKTDSLKNGEGRFELEPNGLKRLFIKKSWLYVEPSEESLRKLGYMCLGSIPRELEKEARIFVREINSRLYKR